VCRHEAVLRRVARRESLINRFEHNSKSLSMLKPPIDESPCALAFVSSSLLYHILSLLYPLVCSTCRC
jgi:hypothetical protein